MQWYANPDVLSNGNNLQLHRRSTTRIGAHSSTANVGIRLVREDVLPDEELRVLRLDNRDVVNSHRKAIMELQNLPLQAARKLACCAVGYPVATRRPCLVDGKSELLAQPG